MSAIRMLVVIAFCFVGLPRAFADAPEPPDTVALLPLDADAQLEIYGQPVASEIARALVAGKLDVVVVGAKMAVPVRTRLIVDGSIKSRGDMVVLSIRIRNPIDGTVLETLVETATRLGNIDQAAAALSARVLPVVTGRITELHRGTTPRTTGPKIDVRPPPVPQQDPSLLVAISVGHDASPQVEPLRLAFSDAVSTWTHASHRIAVPVDAATLAPKLASETVRKRQVERGVMFEILSYVVSPGTTDKVPSARARVHVRIAEPSGVVFDRIVTTDSVVGDRAITPDGLAARVAREVLAILRPHMRKLEATWR